MPIRAQIVGADALSRWVDWSDRNTCVLFGDGAGAMVSINACVCVCKCMCGRDTFWLFTSGTSALVNIRSCMYVHIYVCLIARPVCSLQMMLASCNAQGPVCKNVHMRVFVWSKLSGVTCVNPQSMHIDIGTMFLLTKCKHIHKPCIYSVHTYD
jgi:hypothetical protein